MKKYGSLIIILLVIYMQACSTRQVYDSIQYNERLKCQEVHHSEYDDCIERTSESYDKYKEKRDAVIEGGSDRL